MERKIVLKQGDPTGGNQQVVYAELTEEQLEQIKSHGILALPIDEITDPFEGQLIYNKDLDIRFQYVSGSWVQCGGETILREGLINGSLYVNEVTVG